MSDITPFDDSLYALKADRLLLSSLASVLQEPICEDDAAQFIALDQHINQEFERLSYRLASEESK